MNVLKQYLTWKEWRKLKDSTADLMTMIRKNILWKKKQLREDLSIGEKVYALAERIKRKSAPGKFYK